MEAIAIISCVAAVVSAFKDGAFIVQQIKEKRRSRGALPPTTLLEKSLKKGSQAVEEAKDDGIQKYGPEFAIGDQIATDALKDVIIELQGSLITHLRKASEDDSMIDFTILVDASDCGRIKALSILNGLYLRKKNAAPISEVAPQTLPPIAPPEDYLSNPEKTNRRLLHRGFSQSLDDQKGFDVTTIDSRRTILPIDPSQPALSYQLTKIPETSTRSSKEEPIENEPGHQNRGPERNIVGNDSTLPSGHSSPMTVSSQFPADEDNPWETEFSTSPKATSKANPERRRDSQVNLPEIVRRQLTNESKSPAEEAYGGFCKGAFRLQVGLTKDGLKLRNSSVSFQGERYYWACGSSKCAFEGPSCKVNKGWGFDDTIYHYGGVRYRWIFLAKSHVTLAKVKDRKYNYRCVFCVFQGQGSPVFRSDEGLMQHVSQHRGEKYDEVILPRVKCISMRQAADEEDFDINLTPADTKASPGQAVKSHSAYDDLGLWPTSEDTISASNHWEDLT